MKWIMLTCLKNNEKAMSFYADKLKYTLDKTSPSIFDLQNIEEYTYEIFSKKLSK